MHSLNVMECINLQQDPDSLACFHTQPWVGVRDRNHGYMSVAQERGYAWPSGAVSQIKADKLC